MMHLQNTEKNTKNHMKALKKQKNMLSKMAKNTIPRHKLQNLNIIQPSVSNDSNLESAISSIKDWN